MKGKTDLEVVFTDFIRSGKANDRIVDWMKERRALGLSARIWDMLWRQYDDYVEMSYDSCTFYEWLKSEGWDF